MDFVFIVHKEHFGCYVFKDKKSAEEFIGSSYDTMLFGLRFLDGAGSVIEEHINKEGEKIVREGVYLVHRYGTVIPLAFRTQAAALEFLACHNGESIFEQYYTCEWHPFEFDYESVRL